MNYITLPDKRYVTASVLHVKSIPHESLFSDMSASQHEGISVIDDNREEIASLLSQVYQYYLECDKSMIAIEILWLTQDVKNQTYRASIDLFITTRAISASLKEANEIVNTISGFCENSLSLQWYEYNECSTDYLAKKLMPLRDKQMRAVVKEERMDPLPFQAMPQCYMFDKISSTSNDFRKIAGTLINYPESAVMIQLMPTRYEQNTEMLLLQMSQTLLNIATGFDDPIEGKMKILTVQKPSALYSFYSKERNHPLFEFNVVVAGDKNSVMALGSRVAGTLNEGVKPEDRANVRFVDLPADKVLAHPETQFFSIPWHVSSIIRERKTGCKVPPALSKLSSVITIDECCSLFGLPIGSKRLGAGLSVNETGRKSRSYSSGIINSGDISMGRLHVAGDDEIGIRLSDLAKHMLIAGTPGSGKTTFSVGLLDRLWKDHHIPFLVIEPAKNEYRALVQSIPELQVFTPGKNFISPFVFNPFVPPKNVRLETYKSSLKTAFAAGVSMSSPLDKIFEDTVNNCYSNFRWLDTYTTDDKGEIFNIADFIKCFQQTFNEIGYTGDARNIGRAGIVRLKSLVNLFDNYSSIPIEDILSKPTIIELAAIENADQKALIIALLLLSILAYVNANYVGEGGLRNFILLEEAHVLLDADSHSGSEGAANPAAIAQGLVKRMLAEIRSYGVGLAIADQSPRKVGIDIVALTDIKVAFRLVEQQDKEILSNATSMTDIQVARLAKLKPGEAFLFFNKLDEPEEIITPDYRLNNNISISLSDEGIKELSTYWNKCQGKLRPYPECQLCPYCKTTCDYNRRVLAREVARRLFNKHVGVGCKEKEMMVNVLKRITSLVQEELNDEPISRELVSCVKVYLWRHVKYDTLFTFSENVIINSLTLK